MVKSLICGSGFFHFHHQSEEYEEDEEENEPSISSSTPRKSRKRSRSKDESQNPFAGMGRDKFSKLVAELEDKKQKIYAQMGSDYDGTHLVRFSFSNSNHYKPIVVRVREREREKNSIDRRDKIKPAAPAHDSEDFLDDNDARRRRIDSADQKTTTTTKKKKMRDSRNVMMKMEMEMGRNCCYFLAAIVVVLVLLAVFGRSFTILCTALGWYLVAAIKGGSSSNGRRKNSLYGLGDLDRKRKK